MIISPHPQRSPEWHNERLGLPTMSRASDILTRKGLKRSESAEKYIEDLAGEILTGRPTERYVSWEMKMHAEREPEARALYMLKKGVHVEEVGLCWPNEQKKYGASPDGLIDDDDGGLEIKGALPRIQIKRLLKGWKVADQPWHQAQGGMLVCDREWWDIMSYCPGLRPIIIRVKRDHIFTEALERELNDFCFDLAVLVQRIKGAA